MSFVSKRVYAPSKGQHSGRREAKCPDLAAQCGERLQKNFLKLFECFQPFKTLIQT